MKRYPIRILATPHQPTDQVTFDKVIRASATPILEFTNDSVLLRYYQGITHAQARIDMLHQQDRPLFEPDCTLPQLSPELARFLTPARMHWQDLGTYRGRNLQLLNLMSDSSTWTTKTFASL